MKRIALVALLVLLSVPATAGSLFPDAKPCFIAGNAGYQISDSAAGAIIVRIDNAAAQPNLRMQLVDDAGSADFVLVDDADTIDACKGIAAIKTIRLDPAAAHADLTVSLSREPADFKIFVRSDVYTEQDAAALFAVIWKGSSGREFARRN